MVIAEWLLLRSYNEWNLGTKLCPLSEINAAVVSAVLLSVLYSEEFVMKSGFSSDGRGDCLFNSGLDNV